MPSFKAEKLRVNLRLSINRLKLLEKKKSEFQACSYTYLPFIMNFLYVRVIVVMQHTRTTHTHTHTHTHTLLIAETAMKARREIADYMKSGRIERARIRVSHCSYIYSSSCSHVIEPY